MSDSNSETQERRALRRYREMYTQIPRVGLGVELSYYNVEKKQWRRAFTTPVEEMIETADGKWVFSTENHVYVPE